MAGYKVRDFQEDVIHGLALTSYDPLLNVYLFLEVLNISIYHVGLQVLDHIMGINPFLFKYGQQQNK